MRWRLFAAFVCLLAVGRPGRAAEGAAGKEKELPYRWVFISQGVESGAELEKALNLIRSAAQHGYTGILFDPDFTNIAQWPRLKLEQVKKVKAECALLKLDLAALLMSAGYSSGICSANPNLAEGLPVNDVLFEVRNGKAEVVPDWPLSPADGRLETAAGDSVKGFEMQDEPGRTTFVDRQVLHAGRPSLRLEPAAEKNRARIMKAFPEKYKHYLVRFWAKEAGLTPPRVTICQYDKDFQTNCYPIEIGADWKKIEFPVLTGASTETRLYIGTWEGKKGRLWLADFEIFEPGLVNVLRRPGAPLTVLQDGGHEIYEEGVDFEKVADPALKINQGYHTPPAIKIIPGGRIKEGARLRVGYYVHPLLRKGQAVCCMSEPQTYEIWKTAVQKIYEAVQPSFWFLDMDEIRGGGTCQACQNRKNADGSKMTPAQILGDCITRQCQLIKTVCPQAVIACWGDMLDPNHNGVSKYYTVPGGYAGAWQYIPKDLVICPWALEFGEQSVSFFDGLGMRTIAGAYYDADNLEGSKKWLELMLKYPKGSGMLYTTWENKYELMPAFGDMLKQ